MCLIPIVAPGASYHHTARQSAAFQRFPKMHNLTPLRSIICRLIWISISRMIDLVWFWVAHKVWTLNKLETLNKDTMTDKDHNYLHISWQECARASRSLRFVARARVRARSIWTEAQRLWLRPRHPRHPAVSSNLLRLSLFLRHTLMSAINYTYTFFWGCSFADSLFPLPFLHSKLWINTVWSIKRGFSVSVC